MIYPFLRYYTCFGCRKLAFICRKCDHGNIYCGSTCSDQARQDSSRRSSAKHRKTPAGQANHRRHMRDYRKRQQLFTRVCKKRPFENTKSDHASHQPQEVANSTQTRVLPIGKNLPKETRAHLCCFCEQSSSDFLRL